MGCTSSKPIGSEAKGIQGSVVYTTAGSFTKIINEKCSHIRLDHINACKRLTVQGSRFDFNLKYCYVSQRGYYPNALNKANQDSYLICERMSGDDNCHLFGIFDGKL